MSDLTTCEAIRSAISSPALADGRGRCAWLDGPTNDLFGPAVVPANLSARQAKDLGLTTLDTSGRIGNGSLASDALQRSLASRLRRRLTGSVSCEVIWKRWDTPWGQCLSKPRARVRSTSGIVIGLWPTMTSNAPARDGYNEARNSAGQVAIRKIVLALWPTARASDGEKGGPNMNFGAGGLPLPSSAYRVANMSNAPMEKHRSGGGSLHPEFAGWEMGYPPEWLSCAPSETQSIRVRRQRSSQQPTKR